MNPTIVVTGVSSGIGYDAVRYLSQHGYFVFGSVRSAEAKSRLESEFPENFEALVFDYPALVVASDGDDTSLLE